MKIIPHSRPTLGPEESYAAVTVLDSGNLATGEKVEEFEEAVAHFIGRKYAVATVSGTAALFLALTSLNIKFEKVVLIPSYACHALLSAVTCSGASSAIFDICRRIDMAERKYDAIIVPHIFGFFWSAEYFGDCVTIPLIEDCAHAIGGKYKDKMFGQFGTVSVFSFYATKMMTSGGMGGMLLTDDKDIANKARDIRHNNDFEPSSLNLRMPDLSAAIGIIQLKKLPGFIEKRKTLFTKYNSLLPEEYQSILIPQKDEEPAYYRFIAGLKNHNVSAIIDKMKARGIFCGRGVLKPLHRIVGFDPEKYPETERLWNSIISLPLYPSLTEGDVEYIVENFLEVINDN